MSGKNKTAVLLCRQSLPRHEASVIIHKSEYSVELSTPPLALMTLPGSYESVPAHIRPPLCSLGDFGDDSERRSTILSSCRERLLYQMVIQCGFVDVTDRRKGGKRNLSGSKLFKDTALEVLPTKTRVIEMKQ